MNPKLVKTLLLAASLGFFILWILEALRTGLSSSYWLLMISLTFLLIHQYYRLRTLPEGTPPPKSPGPKPRPVPKRKKK